MELPPPRYLTRKFARKLSGLPDDSLNEDKLYRAKAEKVFQQIKSTKKTRRKRKTPHRGFSLSVSQSTRIRSNSEQLCFDFDKPISKLVYSSIQKAAFSSSLDAMVPINRFPFIYQKLIKKFGGKTSFQSDGLLALQQLIVDVLTRPDLFIFPGQPLSSKEENKIHRNKVIFQTSDDKIQRLITSFHQKPDKTREQLLFQFFFTIIPYHPSILKNHKSSGKFLFDIDSFLESSLKNMDPDDSESDTDSQDSHSQDSRLSSSTQIPSLQYLRNQLSAEFKVAYEQNRLMHNDRDSEQSSVDRFSIPSIETTIHSYHQLMDSQPVKALRSSYSTPVEWTSAQWTRFTKLLKKYGYSPTANRRIASEMGPGVHPNHVAFQKRIYKKSKQE